MSVVRCVLLNHEVQMRFSLMFVPALMMIGLSACHQEGPAESAGRSLDNAGKSVSDAVNPPQGPAESNGAENRSRAGQLAFLIRNDRG